MRRKRSSRGSLPVTSRTIARRAPRVRVDLAAGARLGERLEVRLHAGDLRDRAADRPLELARRSSCASSSDRSPGSFRCSESSVRPSTSTSVMLCTSRTPRHRDRGGVRALAQRRVLERLDVDDDVGVRAARRSTAASTASAAACPWPTAAPGGTPITTSANCRPPAWRMRRRRSSTAGCSARSPRSRRASASAGARSISTSTFALISRAAASSTSTPTKSAAIESPFGWPARASEQADEHGDASRRGRCEVQRVRRERGALVPARRPARDDRAR